MKRIDLAGKKFGRWTVIAPAPRYCWHCLCACGRRGIVEANQLRRGKSKSCGCRRGELAKARFTKHGMSKSKEYRSWVNMKSRCLNPRNPSYEWYGARGITVFSELMSFTDFFAEVQECPEGCSLNRFDSNDHYRVGNIGWATASEQSFNQRPRRKKSKAAKHRHDKPLSPRPLDNVPF